MLSSTVLTYSFETSSIHTHTHTHYTRLPFLVHSRLGFEHSTLTLSRIPIFLFVSFFARALTIALNVPTLRLYLSLSLCVVSHGYTTRVHPLQSSETKSGSETATPFYPPPPSLVSSCRCSSLTVSYSLHPSTFAFKLD